MFEAYLVSKYPTGEKSTTPQSFDDASTIAPPSVGTAQPSCLDQHYIILASSTPHEQNPLFPPPPVAPFQTAAIPPQQQRPNWGPPPPFQWQPPFPGPYPPPPPFMADPHSMIRPPPMPTYFAPNHQMYPPPPPQMAQSEILEEILSFRRRRPPQYRPVPLEFDHTKTDPHNAKRTQDMLCLTLLRIVHFLETEGSINSKILLSRQSPNNELKNLVRSAGELALDAFEVLVPYFACLSNADLEHAGDVGLPVVVDDIMAQQNNKAESTKSSTSQHVTVGHSGSTSIVSSLGPPDCLRSVPSNQSSNGLTAAAGILSAPTQMTTPNNSNFISPESELPAVTAPPSTYGMMPPPQVMEFSYYGPADSSGMRCIDMHQEAPSGIFCAPMNTTYGLPFHRLSDGRRKSGFESNSNDIFTSKRGPTIGDKPLTPPAQGWYAKYSSGVTGVVWDRVHQAWVVSWTLAGKRTFRHFTCKSYGGFDRAREAAIEFRLARNRDIAAYNKRSKEGRR